MKTIKTSSDSAMAQISQMVLEAQGTVTKTEEMMKKFAKVYTPLTLLAALFVFLIPMIVAASKVNITGALLTRMLCTWHLFETTKRCIRKACR